MGNGVNKETGGASRSIVSMIIVLLVVAAVIFVVARNETQKNDSGQENEQESTAAGTDVGDAVVTVALPGLEPEKPEVDSSKEIVGDVLISNVP